MIKKTFKISILLVVFAALSIFISCKTQPTAVSDFQTIEEIPNTTPTPTDTNGSTNINITIDNSKGLSQFAVSHYKSGNYYVNGNVAYYYATVSNNCIVVGAKYTNVTVLEEDANMYLTDSSQTGATYSLKGTRFSQKNENTATATFTEDGYLIIKFSNVSSEIKYSLQSKSEETYNGELIPEEWFGTYDNILASYGYAYTATVMSDKIIYSRTYYISDTTYLGEYTWSWNNPSQYGWQGMIIKFGRNENGQRILTEIMNDIYTNIYLHREDK